MSLAAWVIPGARRTEAVGVADDHLRVRLAAPAVEGKANAELIRFLSRRLGISRRDVEMARGERSRRKVVLLHGVTLEDAKHRLGL